MVCTLHRYSDTFMYAHVRPQAVCLLAQGKQAQLAVDYVARLEHLTQDWPLLVELINARRGPGLPEVLLPGERAVLCPMLNDTMCSTACMHVPAGCCAA